MVNFEYLYNPAAARDSFKLDYFLDKKLGFQVIEHGTILPHKKFTRPNGTWHFGLGGIVDTNGKYISGSEMHRGTGGAYVPPESIKQSSETVIYLGMFYRVWGHDLTDNIRRVWFLKSDYFKSEFKDCPIVYIPYDEGRLTIDKQPSLQRLLKILEVDVDKLQPITQPTQFDKIILPDGSFLSPHNSEKGFTAEYRDTVDRVRDFALKNRTPTSNKKIYHFNGRRGMFEERIAEYFKSKGYEIVRPERLPLDEQLNILINCESFASTVNTSLKRPFLAPGGATGTDARK
ncbi:MAG: glycosyltransferase family 61 protein, partial [Selenomonadaceae bacterium]|nr:glycosyltransferase family 61 protein [Selenomonadaceae bacterium]